MAWLLCLPRTCCFEPLVGAGCVVLSGGTELPVETLATSGADGATDLLTKPHQQPVYLRPLVLGQPGLEADPGLLWSLHDLGVSPAQPRHNPVDMSVHPNTGLTAPGNVHGQVRHLGTDSWQFAETLDTVRDVIIVIVVENLTRLLNIFGFVSPKTNGVNELFQSFSLCFEDVLDCEAVLPEPHHGGVVDLVLGLAGEHQADQALEPPDRGRGLHVMSPLAAHRVHRGVCILPHLLNVRIHLGPVLRGVIAFISNFNG